MPDVALGWVGAGQSRGEEVGGGSRTGFWRGASTFYMGGKWEGRPGRTSALVDARGAQTETLARYWLEEGTNADLVITTRRLLLSLLVGARVFFDRVCLCRIVGVHFKFV